jgi:hypothetical protein
VVPQQFAYMLSYDQALPAQLPTTHAGRKKLDRVT